MPPKIAYRRRISLTDLDQAGRRHPFERLTHGRPRNPEDLRESALTGQAFAGLHLTAEYLGNDLLEHVLRYRPAIDGL
jgi:hypothetical protein